MLTSQGRDALIEKFRESTVMYEDPAYRPKLFYTDGENMGQEEKFPVNAPGVRHSSRSMPVSGTHRPHIPHHRRV